ncbi:MAG: HAD family hydrolase [Candidatus Pacebacteria bacterium]|nr:HAD family hydrolase [Candidatus Paceibacterota bacterium]
MIKNIIFDWSGTLIDDVIFTYSATMKVFEKIGIEEITLEKFKEEFILPYMNFYKKFKNNPDKKIIDEWFDKEMDLINKSKLFPEVKEVLEFLKQKEIKMIILSSYCQESLEREIKDNNLQNFFLNINGSVYDKTEAVIEIMQKNNFKKEETICIGDMTYDIDMGKKAKIKIVAISQGYQSKEKLFEKNPDFLIENLGELKSFILKI